MVLKSRFVVVRVFQSAFLAFVVSEVPFGCLLDSAMSSKLAKSSSMFRSMPSSLDSNADAVLSPLATHLSRATPTCHVGSREHLLGYFLKGLRARFSQA
jgi:hypothetical protein